MSHPRVILRERLGGTSGEDAGLSIRRDGFDPRHAGLNPTRSTVRSAPQGGPVDYRQVQPHSGIRAGGARRPRTVGTPNRGATPG